MKSALGGEVNPKDAESVIEYCISKAYFDMLSGGRFYAIEGKNEKCARIKTILAEAEPPYSFSRGSQRAV